MENNNSISKIDVRIIVSDLEIAQFITKAINNIQLEKDYNIIVSSIIPTSDFAIAKKVAEGGDIILIGGHGQDETYNLMFNDLKTDFNHIALFDYNNILLEDGTLNTTLIQDEILNSIIRATISYSLNFINIHALEDRVMEITRKYNSLLDDYNKVIEENEKLINENSTLSRDIDTFKSDLSRFENMYSKEFLEIYKLNDLWQETFDEALTDDEKIVLATNEFKPDNIIVGQGFIAAKSKQEAIDWLKIIKTALIFIEDSETESSNNDSSDIENTFWD